MIDVESEEDDTYGIGVENSVPIPGGLITPPKLTVPLLAIMPENYHFGRCNLSSNLLDPASDDENICWADQLLPGPFQCSDLEDKN